MGAAENKNASGVGAEGFLGKIKVAMGWGPKAPPAAAAAAVTAPALAPAVTMEIGQPRNPALTAQQIQDITARMEKGLKAPSYEKTAAELKEINALIAQLGNDEFAKREEAQRNLIEIGLKAKPELKDAAKKNSDPEIRNRAAHIVEVYNGVDYRDRVKDVITDVKKLHNQGRRAEALAPLLTKALAEDNWELKLEAVKVLGEIGPSAKETVSALATVVTESKKDKQLKFEAIKALGNIGSSAGAAADVLVAALKDSDGNIRSAAVESLEQIYRKSQNAAPESFSKDKTDQKISEKALAKFLGALKNQEDPEVKAKIIFSIIRSFKSEAKAAVPDLIDIVKKDHILRPLAIMALKEIKPDAEQIVPLLSECLKDPEPLVRMLAVSTLGDFGPDAAKAAPALMKVIKARDDWVTLPAIWALVPIAKDPKTDPTLKTEILEVLTEFKKNPAASSKIKEFTKEKGICSRGEDDKRKASGFVYRLSADFSP
jgi:HEAT repeat protein